MKYNLNWLNTLNVSGLNGVGVTTEGFYVSEEYLEYWKIHNGSPFMIMRGRLDSLLTDIQVAMRVEIMLDFAFRWAPTYAEFKENGGI